MPEMHVAAGVLSLPSTRPHDHFLHPVLQVLIRLALVLVVLGALAGAILATYFLTKQFS
jgi:hypothetical protein